MDSCIFTQCNRVERHHIMGGSRKKACEEYGYIVPLRPDLHPNGAQANRKYAKEIDTYLKQMAQRNFEDKHGTREEFIEIFGKSYL